MKRVDDEGWKQVWGELCDELNGQPRCPEHPQFPCIRTLGQEVVNDILQLDEDSVRVRSHRTAVRRTRTSFQHRRSAHGGPICNSMGRLPSTRTIPTAHAPIE